MQHHDRRGTMDTIMETGPGKQEWEEIEDNRRQAKIVQMERTSKPVQRRNHQGQVNEDGKERLATQGRP